MSGSGRRRGTRIKTRFKSLYSAGEREGSAVLAEISYSGARLECTEFRPSLGTRVCVYVWLPRHAEPFELAGKVARLLDDGFAIEYEKPGQDICNMVDAAVLLVDEVGEVPVQQVEPRAENAPDLLALDLLHYDLSELKTHAVHVQRAIEQKQREARARVRDPMRRVAAKEGASRDGARAKPGRERH
ncbi:MAG TPA: PilZ domain-containing protein [Myxococcota bacterium]